MLYYGDMKTLGTLIQIEIIKVTEKKTASGLYLGKDKWGEKENTGIIIALPSNYDVDPILKVGQTILFNPYALLETNDEKIHLVKEEDVLAILEESDGSTD